MAFAILLFPVHHYMLSPTSLVCPLLNGPLWETSPFIHHAPLIQSVSNTPLFDATTAHLSTALDCELLVGSSVEDQPVPLAHSMGTHKQMTPNDTILPTCYNIRNGLTPPAVQILCILMWVGVIQWEWLLNGFQSLKYKWSLWGSPLKTV